MAGTLLQSALNSGKIDLWQNKRENVYGHQKRLFLILENIFTLFGHDKKIKILDVGCGTGNMITLPVASLGYDVTGIDPDSKSVEIARESNPYPNAKFLCAKSFEVHDKFDFIICSEVMEHLAEPEVLVQDLGRLLKDDGYLFLTVPNGYGYYELDDFIWKKTSFEKILEYWGRFKRKVKGLPSVKKDVEELDSTIDRSPHLQKFTVKKIVKLFAQNNFFVNKVYKSSLLAGKFTNLFLNFQFFIKFNIKVVDYLPSYFASGLYFLISKRDSL